MYSSRSVRRNIFAFFHKLRPGESKKSYKRFDGAMEETKNANQVQKGYVAMYVGEERKRYEVPVKYLSLPKFQELMMNSQDEGDLDFKIDGPITLTCTTEKFEELLKLAKKR